MGRSRFFEYAFNEKIDWLTFKYVLVHVDMDFKMPIHFHDDLRCESAILEVGNSSFSMEQRLVDQSTGNVKTLCHAVVVYFDREANKSERIPERDREKLGELKVESK
jgi:acyl-CoA thioester hydrolase